MPAFSRKGKGQPLRPCSVFLDKVMKEDAVASCSCGVYFPEMDCIVNNFGTKTEVCTCVSGEHLICHKYCMIYLCKNQGELILQDIDEDLQICFDVVLNKCRSNELIYEIRDKFLHEFSQKLGAKWQKSFILKFDEDDKQLYQDFETELKTILQKVKSSTETIPTYRLLAIQTKEQRRRNCLVAGILSIPSADKIVKYTIEKQNAITRHGNITEDNVENFDECSSEESIESPKDNPTPPFTLAPFIPIDFTGNIVSESYDNVNKNLEPVKSNTYLQDSLHIHSSEFPQRLDSILKSSDFDTEASTYIQPSSYCQHVVVDKWQNNDITAKKWNSYSGDYVQMGITKQMAKPNSEVIYETMVQLDKISEPNISEHNSQNAMLKHVQELAHHLEAAINEKVVTDAQRFAKMLALLNVKVSISVQLKQDDENNKEFKLKVNIEDRDTSGGSILLTVRATDTIQDLKNKMFFKHMFPVAVQYWIIGKRIPQDTETLAQCKIKSHGYTAFLYLVSAKSVKLTKEEFLRPRSSEPDVNAASFMPSTATSQMPCGVTAGVHSTEIAGGLLNPKMDEIAINLNNNKIEKTTHQKLNVARHRQPSPGEDVINHLGPSAKARTVVTDGCAANSGNLSKKESGPFQETAARVTLLKSAPKVPVEDDEPMVGWSCEACTYINQPTRPGCEVCSHPRPADYEIPPGCVLSQKEQMRLEMEKLIEMNAREAQENERRQNYEHFKLIDNTGIIPNADPFACPICFDDISVGQGVVLRECLHTFCRDCLKKAIIYNEEPTLQCPYNDDSYSCDSVLQDREVKALVSKDVYSKYLARSVALAESQAHNSFHCKTADCQGWCIYEDHVNFFLCPVCFQENCLTCKAIHLGMNCKQYQDDLKIRAVNDKAASQTHLMIKKMLDDGDAMNCPQCQVIVMKKEGCDWIQCSICKTEICWVTKGPRWGPEGNGDISGGCKCRVDGKICHPACNNCH